MLRTPLCARFPQIFHNSKISQQEAFRRTSHFHLSQDRSRNVSPYLFLFCCSLHNYDEVKGSPAYLSVFLKCIQLFPNSCFAYFTSAGLLNSPSSALVSRKVIYSTWKLIPIKRARRKITCE